MLPTQLAGLPVYQLAEQDAPARFIHVTDVISKEYATKFELEELCALLDSLGADRAVRTAESQFALWIPRKGVDTFSLIDQKITISEKQTNVLVHNDGCYFFINKNTKKQKQVRAAA